MVRLYWLGEVLDSTRIATYTVIFIQIGQPFRKISTDKLFRTHTDRQADRQTDTHTHRHSHTHTHTHPHAHTHTRQAKNQFSWRFSVSRVRKCAELNLDFLTVFQYFHSFYEHGSKKRHGLHYTKVRMENLHVNGIMNTNASICMIT